MLKHADSMSTDRRRAIKNVDSQGGNVEPSRTKNVDSQGGNTIYNYDTQLRYTVTIHNYENETQTMYDIQFIESEYGNFWS